MRPLFSAYEPFIKAPCAKVPSLCHTSSSLKKAPITAPLCVSQFDAMLYTWEPMYLHFPERAIWRAAGQYTFIESAFPWMLQQSVKPRCHFPPYSAYCINLSHKSVILRSERGHSHRHTAEAHVDTRFRSFNGRKSIALSGRRNSIR